MKLQSAIHRLLEDPTLEMEHLHPYPTDREFVLVIKANLKEVAPSRDDIRWDSALYLKGTNKEAHLSVRDYLATDWTVHKPRNKK